MPSKQRSLELKNLRRRGVGGLPPIPETGGYFVEGPLRGTANAETPVQLREYPSGLGRRFWVRPETPNQGWETPPQLQAKPRKASGTLPRCPPGGAQPNGTGLVGQHLRDRSGEGCLGTEVCLFNPLLPLTVFPRLPSPLRRLQAPLMCLPSPSPAPLPPPFLTLCP